MVRVGKPAEDFKLYLVHKETKLDFKNKCQIQDITEVSLDFSRTDLLYNYVSSLPV